MKKIKFFKGIENELNALEEEITEWLTQTGAEIISINGNIAPQGGDGGSSSMMGQTSFSSSDVLVIVLYEDGKPARNA